ncbi:alpha/beta hydrolase [Nocardioides flavescens]|uniref:Alpha/beta fold hydrolase n=1 Tax=Nocardioides flavescens TaxID=2691959 RepID=A0A6L7F222_9ACTN|nr:alpha/beta hydrolase [Nocardioides flavescens]MXG89244.1 alpha/beta fold hydrolase [Nocardioides flavescens]
MRSTASRVVAVVLVVLLVVGAAGVAVFELRGDGSSGGSGSASRATLAPTPEAQDGATDAPSPELATFYDQSIDWQLCRGDDFECATLTVPIDYADPGGETIDLALLKVPARKPGERVGSLVVNPGGPGASGVEYAAQASFAFRDRLLDSFDIVGFDPRGTGGSDPVDCLSDSQLDEFRAADPDPDTAAEGQAYQQGLEEFYAGCLERSDSLIGHVTTIEAARDMDVLRAALGETQLTYFGASYGTKLGATYADLFPDRVGRLVLDGAVDLSIDSRQLTLEQGAGFEVALRSYVQDCVDGGDCYLGDTVDDGISTIADFIDQVDAEPLPSGDDDRPLTVGLAFTGIVAPLYSQQVWSALDLALGRALDGDGSLLLRLADLFQSRNADGTYSDNSSEAIYAINCLDDPYAISADEVPAQIPAFEEASPTFGAAFAWQLVNCEGIQVTSSEPARDVTAAGAAPIVVVGTTRDPATPYQWAVHLADQLESGVLVTRDGDGHTGYNQGNECVDTALEDYLVEGTVPDDGLQC